MAKNNTFSAEIDAAITSSYDGLGVHEKMLKDGIRTGSYLEALERNPSLVEGKTVLDVGCGTGILSLFAARAGAEHVYAVDVSEMIESAKRIAATNGFGDRITFIKSRIEIAELPKVDIIVSEWQGFCLLSEFNLDCVLVARDRFLKQGGVMMPDMNSLYIAGIQDGTRRDAKVGYWDDVYGFDFSSLKSTALKTGYLTIPGPSTVVTNAVRVLELDMHKVKSTEDSLYTAIPFKLQANRSTTVDAIVAWFDYQFTKGEHPVTVSTGPFSQPTHWKQTVFLLEKPVKLGKGESLNGKVTFVQADRDLDVIFEYSTNVDSEQIKGRYKVDCIEV